MFQRFQPPFLYNLLYACLHLLQLLLWQQAFCHQESLALKLKQPVIRDVSYVWFGCLMLGCLLSGRYGPLASQLHSCCR